MGNSHILDLVSQFWFYSSYTLSLVTWTEKYGSNFWSDWSNKPNFELFKISMKNISLLLWSHSSHFQNTSNDNTIARHNQNFWGVSPFAEGGESILVMKLQCFVTDMPQYTDTLENFTYIL